MTDGTSDPVKGDAVVGLSFLSHCTLNSDVDVDFFWFWII